MPVYFDVCVPEEGKNAGIPTEFIRITKVGGTVPDVVHRIATDEDRAKYPDEYQLFQKAQEDAPEGSLQAVEADKVERVHPPAPGKPGWSARYATEHGDRASPRPTLETNPLGSDAPPNLQKALTPPAPWAQAPERTDDAANDEGGESTPGDDLGAMSVDDAANVINGTTDRATLTRMRAAERKGKDRKGVIEAIDARREALKNQG